MAQAIETFLNGWETSSSRAFREEQRGWRGDDIAWRALLRQRCEEKAAQRELFRQWRAYNMEQQVLNNCRSLWGRHVVKNRRDVDEAVEMLKCLAQLGALTAGFAVSAFYDFQYTTSNDNPVLPFFGVATALTVGFELNSCVMCTLMLSAVVKIGKSYISEEEEAEYLWRLREWASAQIPGAAPPAPRRDFQRHWDARCESRWRTAVALFLSGIPTFFAVMGLAGYLKFNTSPPTVVITAVVMTAAFIYTVAMSADWAKALLFGRPADRSSLGWQGGGWWHSPELSHELPFSYHQVPDKDSGWPPGAVLQPRGRTLEEMPYPIILGLQPWPTAVQQAAGNVPEEAGGDLAEGGGGADGGGAGAPEAPGELQPSQAVLTA